MKKKLKFFFTYFPPLRFVLYFLNISLGVQSFLHLHRQKSGTEMQLYAFIQPLWYVFIVRPNNYQRIEKRTRITGKKSGKYRLSIE